METSNAIGIWRDVSSDSDEQILIPNTDQNLVVEDPQASTKKRN